MITATLFVIISWITRMYQVLYTIKSVCVYRRVTRKDLLFQLDIITEGDRLRDSKRAGSKTEYILRLAMKMMYI